MLASGVGTRSLRASAAPPALSTRVTQAVTPRLLGRAQCGVPPSRRGFAASALGKGRPDNGSQATAAKTRKLGTGKDVGAPAPSSADDILLLPNAHLYKDELDKHDIHSVTDLRAVYQREGREGFRAFLQDKVEVREEHAAAMEYFFEALDAAAATARGAARSAAAQANNTPLDAAAAAPPRVGMTSTQVTLSVEGNISAGKSTFLSILQRHLLNDDGYSFVREPIESWQSVGGPGGINLLELFYKDPGRMAYTFQNYVFLTRVLQERETYGATSSARLLERSIFSDRMVFVRAVHASAHLADHELAIYDAWFRPLLASLPTLVPNGLIYLRASPATCMARLMRRARSEEAGVPLSYLQSLHANHEDWLLEAATPAADLQRQLRQAAQEGASPLHGDAAASTSAASAAAAAAASSPRDTHTDAATASPSGATAAAAAAPAAAAAASAGGAVRQVPLSEAPPPALLRVDIPPTIAHCLYIIDATKVSGVPSAGYLHHLPSLLVDCEGDVDVDADVAHGEAMATLIRDFAAFVAAYRAECHRLAAERHPAAAGLRLPSPASDYFATDGEGRVAYRPVPEGVPGAPL